MLFFTLFLARQLNNETGAPGRIISSLNFPPNDSMMYGKLRPNPVPWPVGLVVKG
jgi:hypothetical protein